MSLYGRMQKTSQRLLKKYEQGVTRYKAPGTASGNPANPTIKAGKEYPVSAVQAPEGRKKTYIEGGYIEATDIMLAVAPFEVEPKQSGTMLINGDEYQIVMVDSPTVEPDSPIVWFVGCRK